MEESLNKSGLSAAKKIRNVSATLRSQSELSTRPAWSAGQRSCWRGNATKDSRVGNFPNTVCPLLLQLLSRNFDYELTATCAENTPKTAHSGLISDSSLQKVKNVARTHPYQIPNIAHCVFILLLYDGEFFRQGLITVHGLDNCQAVFFIFTSFTNCQLNFPTNSHRDSHEEIVHSLRLT